MGIIYLITNKLTNKKYVGQTSRSLLTRWREHCYQHECIIDKAIDKYGENNFTIEVIDTADTLDQLNDKEIYWIKYYNSKLPNGYNVSDGGSGISVKKDEQWKRRIGDSNRGNKRPDLSNYNKKTKSKSVVQLSLNDEIIQIWESIRAIENAGIGNHSLIAKICNGDPRRHTAYGYKWKYYESEVS